MNSVRLQDSRLIYRNPLYFYASIMKYQKEKVEKKNLFKNHIKKGKIPRNKLNQGGERPIC